MVLIEFEKRYLGDSVYAEIERGMVKIYTDNGFGPINTIFMEPEIIHQLNRYVADMEAIAKAAREEARDGDVREATD